jgi:hypothetical protein
MANSIASASVLAGQILCIKTLQRHRLAVDADPKITPEASFDSLTLAQGIRLGGVEGLP